MSDPSTAIARLVAMIDANPAKALTMMTVSEARMLADAARPGVLAPVDEVRQQLERALAVTMRERDNAREDLAAALFDGKDNRAELAEWRELAALPELGRAIGTPSEVAVAIVKLAGTVDRRYSTADLNLLAALTAWRLSHR